MKNSLLSFAITFLAFCRVISTEGQVANEGLANKIIDAQKTNAALLKPYSWNSRTEVMDSGKVEDIRIDSVSCGPDGKLQRTLINDQSAPLPGGFLRKRIAEDERKKVEKYFKGLMAVLDQYTLPSAGKVLDFVSQATIQKPDAEGMMRLTGSGVVVPGDSFTLTVAAKTSHIVKMQIATYFEGDMVEVSATFKTLSSGLTHLQFAQLDIAVKGLSVQVHNYDYNQNN